MRRQWTSVQWGIVAYRVGLHRWLLGYEEDWIVGNGDLGCLPLNTLGLGGTLGG